jgi:subtilisin family serine protease
VFLCLILLSPVSAIAFDCTAGSHLLPDIPTGWYTKWYRDADRDRIDDLLAGEATGHGVVDIFVDFHREVKKRDLEVLDTYGDIRYSSDYIDSVGLTGVRSNDLDSIARLPGVAMIEYVPDIIPTLDVSVPAIRAISSTTYSDGARDLGYDGTGTVIAIFDTGVDNTVHDSLNDLDDNTLTNDPKYVAGADFTIPGSGYSESDPEDTDGHGTHVAGIAIGTGGSTGNFKGVALQSKLVDVKVLPTFGYGNAFDFLDALDWCTENKNEYNISVLSMSLGTTGTSDGNDVVSTRVNLAVLRDGFIVIVAAGNDGPDNTGMGSPAAADEAIVVGSVDDYGSVDRTSDNVASTSSRGPREADLDDETVDEFKPDVVAPGVNIMSAQANTPGVYISKSGTSMATPHVSGTVALMLEANEELSARDVKRILRDTAEARGSAYDSSVDPKYNNAYGWGLVDAYGAVKRAQNLANGEFQGPKSVSSGSSGIYKTTMPLTRTEYTTTADNVTFNISIPEVWGKPSDIEITCQGSTSHTTGFTEPGRNLTHWRFDAWIEFSENVSSSTELNPVVQFKTFAPEEQASYIFNGIPIINGVEGVHYSYNITTTPSTAGDPDFLITANDISFSNDEPISAQLVQISGEVHNIGNKGANANVSFYDGNPETGILLGIDSVSVPAGGSDQATITWLATPGTHEMFVVVDPQDLIDEADENNNIASKNITVTGINSPPTAQLVVTPTEAGVNEFVFFDGSESSDVDGVVVLYNFNFGDGNSSGWVPSSNVTHSYEFDGIYIGSLQVQDNGGARSTNTAEEIIHIAKTTTERRTLYMHDGSRLLFTEPSAGSASKAELPDGFEPSWPGSPVGTVEEREVGAWNTNPFEKNATIEGTVKVHIWVNNTGSETIEVTSFRFAVEHNEHAIGQTEITPPDLEPGLSIELIATFPINTTRVSNNDYLAEHIWCTINGDGGVLEFGSLKRDSGVDITFTTFLGVPPVADAGENKTVKVNETVYFNGVGTDEDGKVVNYEWDFESDGTWDFANSVSGYAEHRYETVGIYNATLRVTDDNGETDSDHAKVTVLQENRAPVITNPSPPGDVNVEEESSKAFSVYISDPDGDEVNSTWYLDGTSTGVTGTQFIYTPAKGATGTHPVKVVATDGDLTSSHTWTVTVVRKNNPPIITSKFPDNNISVVYQGEEAYFSVQATDEDGDDLSYKWKMNDLTAGSSMSLSFETDESHVGSHFVTVEVSDGALSASESWGLQVIAVNNDPVIKWYTPEEGSVFSENDQITFEVGASDPDGDLLTYEWRSNIDGRLGVSDSIAVSLSNGTHTVDLTVTDSRGGEVKISITVIVKKATKSEDGMDYAGPAALVVLLVVLGLVFLLVLRTRQKHREAWARHYQEQEEYGEDYEEEHDEYHVVEHEEEYEEEPPEPVRKKVKKKPAVKKMVKKKMVKRPVRKKVKKKAKRS